MISQEENLSKEIADLAKANGIDTIGFTKAAKFDRYLLKTSRRRDPKLAMPDAETIIVAGIYIGGMVLPSWDNPSFGRTSRLFLSGFFLDVVAPLTSLADLLRKAGYSAIICDGRLDDGSIIPLKLAAIRAGLGWQGKHSLLISKKFGTFLALGGIVTNAPLEPNSTREKNRCEKCRLCQDACPLDALEKPYALQTDKCLSNLLQSDHMTRVAISAQGNRIADCEICQNACPWNRKHIKNPLQTESTTAFHQKTAKWEDFFQLEKLRLLSEKEYAATLGRLETGIAYTLFRRNVLQAIKNGNAG
jgi:epoxyqueuosine reductase